MSNYQIRQIKDSKHKDFTTLMRLYNENISPSIKTNTNEIIYWLDHFKEIRKMDSFWILALYLNNYPIGFCQGIYLKTEKIVFIDYCVIDPDYRGRAFSEFSYMIRDFFVEKKLDINYYITEVAYLNQRLIPAESALKLMRLIKMTGFKVIKALYVQPELGLGNHESEMNAALMIFINGGCDYQSIKKETYLDIVHTVFYRHYIPWYQPFMDPKEWEMYRKKVDNAYNKITANIEHDPIALKGEPMKFPLVSPPKYHMFKIILSILTPILLVIITFFLVYYLEHVWGVQSNTQYVVWSIVGIILSISLIIKSIIQKDWNVVISWIKDLFD